MIEILSSELSQAIQLVGLVEQGGRPVPSRILFALREEGGAHPGCGVRGLWLGSGSLVPVEALEDLVREWFPAPGKRAPSPPTGRCVICGGKNHEGLVSVGGQYICWEHVPCYWEELLATQEAGAWICGRCSKCGVEGVLCWARKGFCTRCLVNEIKNLPGAGRWILVAGPVLPKRGEGELKAFLEAWRRAGACPRCGSKAIRVRRLIMDFPRARAPIFPLWELTREDMTPEGMVLRQRQLRIFTEGLLRATVECPQCGYMDLEFPGPDSLAGENSPFLDL